MLLKGYKGADIVFLNSFMSNKFKYFKIKAAMCSMDLK